MADTSVSFASSAPAGSSVSARNVQRHIGPKSARALAVLGHAIEHLTDEFGQEDASIAAKKPRIEAVRLLMDLNRQIYFECPEMPSLDERWHTFVRELRKTRSRVISATRFLELMPERRPAEDL